MQLLAQRAARIRRLIVDTALHVQSSHVGSSLSVVEILTSIFAQKKSTDKIILSKGHAVLAYYAALVEFGFLDETELKNYLKKGSKMWGHASTQTHEQIYWSTGSLGHGLSVACGMGHALKRKGNQHSKIYVIMSDGECDCGSTWEAALFASHYSLSNVVAFIDHNGLQATGRTKDVLNLDPLDQKWHSFGWDVRPVEGHDVSKITDVLMAPSNQKPQLILARTVKGRGIFNMENKVSSHYSKLLVDDCLGLGP